MTDPNLQLLIEPKQLEPLLDSPDILVVDLCKHDVYATIHIPGAVHLDYAQIVAAKPPVMGLLPDADTLSQLFSGIGLTPDKHVVAYDDEGGADYEAEPDYIDELERLASLKEKGIITEEDFEAKKKELLGL